MQKLWLPTRLKFPTLQNSRKTPTSFNQAWPPGEEGEGEEIFDWLDVIFVICYIWYCSPRDIDSEVYTIKSWHG